MTRKNKIVIPLIMLLIFGLGMINIKNSIVPFVFNDEYGYWSNAAWLNGYNWSATTSEISWYSYGYSFILAVFIFIAPNMLWAYKMAVIFNCVLLSLCFLFLYKISIYFTHENNLIYSIFPIVYCSNIVNLSYAIPEMLLFFLFVLLIYLMIKYYESRKFLILMEITINLIFMYMIHMRTVGIILASAIFLLLISDKRNFKELILASVLLISGILIQIRLKEYFGTNLWLDGSNTNTNSYSSVLWNDPNEKIGAILFKIIVSFIGKVYYLIVSTMGLIGVYILAILVEIKNFFQVRELRKDIIYYIFLCLLAEVGISAIFMRNPAYVTHLLYGRYSENIVGPVILIAIIYLFENLQCKKMIPYMTIALLLFSQVLMKAINDWKLPETNIAINNVALAHFYDEIGINLSYVSLICVLITLAFLFLMSKWKRWGKIYIIFVLITILNVYIGREAYTKFEDHSYDIVDKEELISLCSMMKEKYSDNKILVYSADRYWDSHACAEIIQFLFPDKNVQYISSREEIVTCSDSIIFFNHYTEKEINDMNLSVDGGKENLFYSIIE